MTLRAIKLPVAFKKRASEMYSIESVFLGHACLRHNSLVNFQEDDRSLGFVFGVAMGCYATRQ